MIDIGVPIRTDEEKTKGVMFIVFGSLGLVGSITSTVAIALSAPMELVVSVLVSLLPVSLPVAGALLIGATMLIIGGVISVSVVGIIKGVSFLQPVHNPEHFLSALRALSLEYTPRIPDWLLDNADYRDQILRIRPALFEQYSSFHQLAFLEQASRNDWHQALQHILENFDVLTLHGDEVVIATQVNCPTPLVVRSTQNSSRQRALNLRIQDERPEYFDQDGQSTVRQLSFSQGEDADLNGSIS